MNQLFIYLTMLWVYHRLDYFMIVDIIHIGIISYCFFIVYFTAKLLIYQF